MSKNILYVAQGEENPALYSRSLIGESPKWILEKEPELPFKCTAKFRYRQKDVPVTVDKNDEGEIIIKFDNAVKAITPGQIAVIYKDEACLGSCIIKAIEPLEEKYRYLNN